MHVVGNSLTQAPIGVTTSAFYMVQGWYGSALLVTVITPKDDEWAEIVFREIP